jgi:hypothetical protein
LVATNHNIGKVWVVCHSIAQLRSSGAFATFEQFEKGKMVGNSELLYYSHMFVHRVVRSTKWSRCSLFIRL